MRRVAFALSVAVAFLFSLHSAHAGLLVHIDKSRQRLTVTADGDVLHSWAVSTGRAGYGTPNGSYRPQRLARRWFSRKYYNSPMPHSIFFNGGFAIHGSYEIHRLGGPASHGCVRLHPVHAAALYGLVQRHGMGSTRIVVSGAIPATRAPVRARPRWQYEPPPYRYYQPRYYYYDWEG
ncbi:MAG: L,D-transpeptidase [Xanthobacteraceae bacterium]